MTKLNWGGLGVDLFIYTNLMAPLYTNNQKPETEMVKGP